MNKFIKYVASITALIVVAYVGWIVIKSVFPIEEWLEQNPSWKAIFSLLLVVGVMGVIAAVVTQKGKRI